MRVSAYQWYSVRGIFKCQYYFCFHEQLQTATFVTCSFLNRNVAKSSNKRFSNSAEC